MIIDDHELMQLVPPAAEEMVQPKLVAIYDERPDQVGTAFLKSQLPLFVEM